MTIQLNCLEILSMKALLVVVKQEIMQLSHMNWIAKIWIVGNLSVIYVGDGGMKLL